MEQLTQSDHGTFLNTTASAPPALKSWLAAWADVVDTKHNLLLPPSLRGVRADFDVAKLRELPFDDIAEDLHVAMGVRREAASGRDAVLVDHAERTEAHL